VTAFRQAIELHGWIHDQNVRVEYRWGASDNDRLRDGAKELIGLRPDVIVAESTPAVSALRQVTRDTPIVFLLASNPIGFGFVSSLARPGGNITGFTNFVPSIGGKWLEVLKAIAPRLSRVAALFNPRTHTGQFSKTLAEVAPQLELELIETPVHDPGEIERAMNSFAQVPRSGVLVLPDTFTLVHRELIVDLAARNSLPALYAYRFFVTGGGLVSYGIDIVSLYRAAGGYVDRILRGEKPADLPVQAPTKFELVINLKTAKALGLDVPATLLASADEVIE
jgi:putative ABC transport system substrate-binding protein